MNQERLAGRFTLVARDDFSITIGLVGNVEAKSLTNEEIRYLSAFYTDGKFIVNAANILNQNDKITGMKLPKSNFNSFMRICITKLDRNMPEDEYQQLIAEELDTGIEIFG